MTSLAVVFVLLLVIFVNAAPSAPTPAARAGPPPPATTPPVDASRAETRAEALVDTAPAELRQLLQEVSPGGLALETDPRDAEALRVAIPESLLNFEFGRSALPPGADHFVEELMPAYARVLCGRLRDRVAGIVIEGHTDDLGSDVVNLRLSQERSFRVLVRSLEAVQAAAPEVHACFLELASASGRGKQDLVYDQTRQPDRASSRRVVLKILLRPLAPRA
jgi:outer membrane protein OmpA-like peptidoglycan-associated protein